MEEPLDARPTRPRATVPRTAQRSLSVQDGESGGSSCLGTRIGATNTIEALHRQIRKTIKTRGHFPTEEAARKLIYLSITNANFGDRLP